MVSTSSTLTTPMLLMTGCSLDVLQKSAMFRLVIRALVGSIRYIKPPLYPSS
ncbi:hypothetical protein Gotur_018631, partial [Gossypium turneri]